MSKPELSNYFLENSVSTPNSIYCDSKNKKMTIAEYSVSKKVKSANTKTKDSDRSICQMLRNINGMTGFKHHEEIVLLVNFTNNAVVRLGKHSKAKDNRWGGSKTRSDFTEEKRSLGLLYLENPHHSFFEKIKSIWEKTSDQKVADYIVEISYYMERINSKILEYEKAKQSE